MSYKLPGILLLAVLAASAAEPDHVPGRLLAGLRSDADPAAVARAFTAHRAIQRRSAGSFAILDVPEDPSGALLASLRRSGLFEYVEPDYYAHTAGDPNDPSYIAQWHLPRIGSPLAWSLNTGSSSLVVAVVDSGVYAYHPDLAAKLVPGWNFVKDNADTTDVLGHGTAVAGTVAASTNNGIGVAGVTWGARVMPLVAVDATDFASYSAIAAAIQYAVDHGVRVINVSIGGAAQSYTLQKAVDYAWSKGALVFASAMNQGVSTPYYPAACAHAIAISASDANDRLAPFSNFCSWITLGDIIPQQVECISLSLFLLPFSQSLDASDRSRVNKRICPAPLEVSYFRGGHFVLPGYLLSWRPFQPARRCWKLVPVFSVKRVVSEPTSRSGHLLEHERQPSSFDLIP